MSFTPPAHYRGNDDDFRPPETPAPQRARVNNLNKQVDRLVKEKHVLQRKASADQSKLETTVNEQQTRLLDKEKALREVTATLEIAQRELERCKAEGAGMRDEMNNYAVLHQHKALLALAEEQLHVVELEQQLVRAEQTRVMRDHKIALFHAREGDLLAELAEKVAYIDDIEAALEDAQHSLKNQASSSAKSSAGLSTLMADKTTLQAKVEQLEASVRGWKEKEKEARAELEGWLKDEKSKDGASDTEKRALQKELRTAKTDLQRRTNEVSDLQEELDALKELSRERERTLKDKLRAAMELRSRDVSADVEQVVPVKAAAASKPKARKPADSGSEAEAPPKKIKKVALPKKIVKPAPKAAAVPKQASADSESDSPAPVASPRKPKTTKTNKQPLGDSTETNQTVKKAAAASRPKEKEKEKEKRKSPELVSVPDADETPAKAMAGAGAGGDKKKKRKFGLKAAPAFQWDPIEGSGTGVIPSNLSPMLQKGKSAISIPRSGFPSAPSNRLLSKFM